MSKSKIVFTCSECGYETLRWLGRCPECGEFNTMVEQTAALRLPTTLRRLSPNSAVVSLADNSEKPPARRETGISEFSRVLGGGLVAGSVILLAGDPGIGKSTLLLQVCREFAKSQDAVLYISAEESVHQVQGRARRLGEIPQSLLVAAETDIGVIEEHIGSCHPGLVVIDSIQAVNDAEVSSPPGSLSQVRQCASRLIQLAKQSNLPIFLVGHVTKEGVIAGPRLLEHMVDTVLYLEGERHLGYRLLRGQKNRFGSTDEVGIFEMTEAGLAEVADPSRFFLEQHHGGVSGTALCLVMEGSRPLLVEVQGLVGSAAGPPRRACSGPDYNRLLLILAVLEKQLRLPVSASDVFVNIPGGLRVNEPAADLAIALSLVSGYRDKPLAAGAICIGEIGLTGEVRGVSRIERRLAEASRLGLRHAIVPARANVREFGAGMEIISVENLKQAATKALQVS